MLHSQLAPSFKVQNSRRMGWIVDLHHIVDEPRRILPVEHDQNTIRAQR